MRGFRALAIALMVSVSGPAAGPLAAQWLGEVVLYTLRPQDQARLAARGLQPGGITVTAQGLEVQWLRPGTP